MILVTGASGALGGLIVERLRATTDAHVVAGSRSAGRAGRRIDFDDPRTLADGFAGIDVLVLVSAGYAEDDVVLARHGATIEAAVAAGVRHVIYTSLVGSGERLTIALPHRWTEARLAQSPFEVTVLRNALYAEIPAGMAAQAADAAAANGIFRAPLGDGRVSVAARQDLADAAARVAAEVQRSLDAGERSRHAGRTYELEGVTAVGGAEIAAALARATGRPVRYEASSLARARAELADAPLEPYQVGHTISLMSNISAGFLAASTSDLPGLLGRPPHDVVALIAELAAA